MKFWRVILFALALGVSLAIGVAGWKVQASSIETLARKHAETEKRVNEIRRQCNLAFPRGGINLVKCVEKSL